MVAEVVAARYIDEVECGGSIAFLKSANGGSFGGGRVIFFIFCPGIIIFVVGIVGCNYCRFLAFSSVGLGGGAGVIFGRGRVC